MILDCFGGIYKPPWYMRLWKRLKQTDLKKVIIVLQDYKLITTPQTIDITEFEGKQYVSITGGYFHNLTAKCNLELTGETSIGADLNCEKNLHIPGPKFIVTNGTFKLSPDQHLCTKDFPNELSICSDPTHKEWWSDWKEEEE